MRPIVYLSAFLVWEGPLRTLKIATCLFLLVLVSSSEPGKPLPRVEAATFTVTSLADSGPGTLREAIAVANGAPGADVINFSVTGTINLSSFLLVTDDVTINGNGITLDGGSVTLIMQVRQVTTVMLNDLSFQNGSNPISGGAIENSGTLTIANSTFSNNSATGSGGAILNNGGTLEITNSTFSDNSAQISGGAIYNAGTLTITNSTYSGNSAIQGGAINNSSGSTLKITNSTFNGNSAVGQGGAIESYGMLTITNSTFSGNSATGSGGAILNNGGTLEITDSTFSGNSATGSGGAIYNSGTLAIASSTFSGNSADLAGDTLYRTSGTVNVTSSLIVDGGCLGTITDGGHNLAFNAGGCPGTVADPQLGPLQNNGGPTATMLPAHTGPAVDAYAAPCATTTDQRGIARPQGPLCDIGATEQDGSDVALAANATCNGPDLAVTISAGDGPFNITASAGINTPVNGIGIGTTTINGPEKWDNVTVTETVGDTQSINLGQFKCRTDERPVPLTPAHRSHTTSSFPIFSWTSISIANNYRVFVFDNKVAAERTVDIRQNSGGPTSMILNTPLPDGRLFWRVRGRQNRVWSLWSIRFTLFKDPVAPLIVNTAVPTIELNSLAGGDSGSVPTPTFPPPPNSR